jgi:hypothetical protein
LGFRRVSTISVLTAAAAAALWAAPALGDIPLLPVVHFPTGTTSLRLPARIVNGQIIVRLGIAGRGIDVQLDSGAGNSILDNGTFDDLGLSGSGTDGAFATIPTVAIGDATISNLRFRRRGFSDQPDASSKILGLLGLDLFFSTVVKIDYDAGTVDIIEPSAFHPPEDGSATLPIMPYVGVPIVTAQIDAAKGNHFVIDTGAYTNTVFPRFTDAHKDVFTTDKELRDTRTDRYLRQYRPLCGEIEEQPYAVSQIAVGGLGLRDWVVWKPLEGSCFKEPYLDGLIGYDFLRNFTLYIDFPSRRVILQPHPLYWEATNTIKPSASPQP